MHAFLLVGQGITNFQIPISNLAKNLNAKVMEFPLAKIEDVRNLNNLLRLSFSEPTLIVSENIDGATEEALNAFLKNLEEPQDNVYFALTAPNEKKVLSTIVSRCQVIEERNSKHEIRNEEEIKTFLDMTASQKLAFFDKMRARDEAINFIESLIFFLHEKKELKNMEILLKTRTCLAANGTVNLHLTNLVANISNLKTNNHN